MDTTGMMEVESSYSDFISGDRQAIRMQSLTSRVTQNRSVQKLAGDMGELAPKGAEGQATGSTPDKEVSRQPESSDFNTLIESGLVLEARKFPP
ncbi:hypothetical protein ACRRTK_024542 [Alexandromys fortis]